jgi:4'-phosphopantetheinyl transferase
MNHSWQGAKLPGPLSADMIHVWRILLAADERPSASFLQILSPEEKQRATGFKFEADRRHFVVAHGVLRLLLSAYLRVSPELLGLHPDTHGKPRLADQTGNSIRFNLSRSGELALCAFAQGREVGVDVEKVSHDVDELAIAKRMFAQSEVNQLEALQGDERTAAFFTAWTRLEALAKASGRGLASISQGEVSLPSEEDGSSPVVAKGGPGHDATWRVISLQPALGYAGAIAAEGAGWKIQCLEWLP